MSRSSARATVPQASTSSQDNTLAPNREISFPAQDNLLSPEFVALIAIAIDTARDDDGRTIQRKVVAACLGVAPPYLTRMLTGEKPFPAAKVKQLPDAIERQLARLYAESLGLRVQDPHTDAQLIGRLIAACGDVVSTFHTARLPIKAGRTAKADLPPSGGSR